LRAISKIPAIGESLEPVPTKNRYVKIAGIAVNDHYSK
jgi:hypothetical protein